MGKGFDSVAGASDGGDGLSTAADRSMAEVSMLDVVSPAGFGGSAITSSTRREASNMAAAAPRRPTQENDT
jgi:hypothetical protein